MAMKILAVAEFDPASVLAGHRRALRALGVDYRVAVRDVYMFQAKRINYDWFDVDDHTTPEERESLLAFAREADVLQFHPGIGQPWSYQSSAQRFHDDGENQTLFDLDWPQVNPGAKRISYFHGSRNLAANAEAYAAYWRRGQHAIWASTLDYVHRMGATYAPPALSVLTEPVLPRGADDPIVIVHAPTDRESCQTRTFLDVCQRVGVTSVIVERQPWEHVIATKRQCNAGFDHLRGSFSVNTLENCALGLAPFVGVKPTYTSLLRDLGFAHLDDTLALFPFADAKGFEKHLRILSEDVDQHQALQIIARGWFERSYREDFVAEWLYARYVDLLK